MTHSRRTPPWDAVVAAAFLPKPLDPDALRDALRDAIAATPDDGSAA